MTQVQITKNFRYNGEDLRLMKEWTNKSNPHEAVETFISVALSKAIDPQEMLVSLRKDELGNFNEEVN